MMDLNLLYQWCSIPMEELVSHPALKIRLRIVEDAQEMGRVMAKDLADEIWKAAREHRVFRLIVPCGPKEWYEPFAQMINEEQIAMKHVVCYHMDENLDWEARLLPENDPNNFHTFMEENFYGAVREELRVPAENRHYLTPDNVNWMSREIMSHSIDYTLGGWGQDGHVAFNQARRNPYAVVTADDIRNSRARVQENNWDTILALAHRSMGAAWQFMPPMSVTLGVKECFSAKKIRVYSATGAWKQTALRIALFSDVTEEFPMTLLQEHPDALITATRETACHPIAEHPEWEFRGVDRKIGLESDG